VYPKNCRCRRLLPVNIIIVTVAVFMKNTELKKKVIVDNVFCRVLHAPEKITIIRIDLILQQIGFLWAGVCCPLLS
jgi:hypothetical protein